MSSIKPLETCLLLVDCNNFFVSCEKVFNPKLAGKPVAVLSSNDGCVVARSKELKTLGVPMGAPAFMYKEILERHKVELLSSNFSLYADMSKRVMECLKRHCLEIEVYSIDEAFLTVPLKDVEELASKIRKEVMMWTGIAVSIGMAHTKTLAKLANSIAKDLNEGFFSLFDKPVIENVCFSTPVKQIWGIGKRTDDALKKEGIYTVDELVQKPHEWIRKKFGVGLLRTVLELQNTKAFEGDDAPLKKSITHSRSFGSPLSDFEELSEALSGFTARAAEKLRAQNSFCSYLEVYTFTASPSHDVSCQVVHLQEPTSHTPTLISHVKLGLKAIFKENVQYKKAGITFCGLITGGQVQTSFFGAPEKPNKSQKKLMTLVDTLNQKFGKNTLFFAAEGVDKDGPKNTKCEKRSPRYTTCWDELLKVFS